MTVNLNQHHGTVGVFNNCKLPFKKTHSSSSQKKHFRNSPNWNSDIPTCTYSKICNLFSSTKNIRFLHRSLFHSLYFINVVLYIHHVWLYSLAIKRSADIEENPGPKPNSCDCLSICYWNLNSISAYNLIKLSHLHAYISINKIDIICLSETYLDSSISSFGVTRA